MTVGNLPCHRAEARCGNVGRESGAAGGVRRHGIGALAPPSRRTHMVRGGRRTGQCPRHLVSVEEGMSQRRIYGPPVWKQCCSHSSTMDCGRLVWKTKKGRTSERLIGPHGFGGVGASKYDAPTLRGLRPNGRRAEVRVWGKYVLTENSSVLLIIARGGGIRDGGD